MRRLLWPIAIVITLSACAGLPPKVETLPSATGREGSFDWDSPRPDGLYVSVSDLSSIASSLSFTPLEPRLSGLLHLDATDPDKMDPDGMLLFFFYDDPKYGRVVVKEQLNRTSQSAFEGLLQYNDDPASPVVFSIVSLDDGTQALWEVQKAPSQDGLAPNSIEFLRGDADITILGPDGTLTAEFALEVANLVLPAK
jgi:hypothetical protein